MISGDHEINEAVFTALAACLQFSEGTADRMIQKAYADPENPISPPRERDVIYYWLEREEDPEDEAQEMLPSVSSRKDYSFSGNTGQGSFSSEIPTEIRSFLAYRLLIVCYGPHSEEYAHRIRALLFLDGARKPRGILRSAGIYPIPRPPQPVILREPAGSLWRKRADLTVSLRVKDSLNTSQDAVMILPDIHIHGR